MSNPSLKITSKYFGIAATRYDIKNAVSPYYNGTQKIAFKEKENQKILEKRINTEQIYKILCMLDLSSWFLTFC